MILFYEDETHIRDYQALHTSWFLRGKQNKFLHMAGMPALHYLVLLTRKTADCIAWASSCNAIYFRHFYNMFYMKIQINIL